MNQTPARPAPAYVILPPRAPQPRPRRWRPALLALLLLALLALAALWAWAAAPTRTRAIAEPLPAAGSPEMERLVQVGRYVAITADCAACHTAAGGSPYAGGLAIASPIGAIHSTNITPDRATGIGGYSLDDFDRAVRHGIAPGGGALYPAMPYPAFARMTDADTRALYAYFLHGVPAVAQANRSNEITWPLSLRWPLSIWRKVFAAHTTDPPAGEEVARYGGDAQIARGAYLVQGPGHCGSCHTPRAVTLQEKALDDASPLFLSGGPLIDGWLALNLRGDAATGLGRWPVQDIVSTLKTGRNPHAAVVGTPMRDVVVNSTQHMTEADLTAIARYLKTLPGAASDAARFAPDDATARQLAAGQEPTRGAQLYADNCAACHLTNARGQEHSFPAIAGNPTVLAGDPRGLLRLILDGSKMPPTATRPSNLGMPGFGWRLSDAEAAELATFVRQGFGNHAGAATAAQVAGVRRELAKEHAERDRAANQPPKAGDAP